MLRISHDLLFQTSPAIHVGENCKAHIEITNVTAAIRAATCTSLVVVPGVELTTPEGHLLVYFETLDDLRNQREIL